MTRYRLKKDLPLAKAGTEVFLEWNSILNENDDTIWIIDEESKNKWIEEIKEPKTIYDLERWDTYWYLDFDLKIRNNCNFWWNFIKNAHTCCFLTEREAKRNKLLRELACRTDKWLPEKNEDYYTYSPHWERNFFIFSWGALDCIRYHQGFVFRNEEEYRKYMTEEAKDLLFNL